MTICWQLDKKINESLSVLLYKRRTRHKYVYKIEMRRLHVNLGQFFVFDKIINVSDFKGDGVHLMILNNTDPHSFDIDFKIPYTKGKSYKKGPYYDELPNNLKVKLA